MKAALSGADRGGRLRRCPRARPGQCAPHPADGESIRPMTLGTMRRHGVRGLYLTCRHAAMKPRSTSTRGLMTFRCHRSARACAAAGAASLAPVRYRIGLSERTSCRVASRLFVNKSMKATAHERNTDIQRADLYHAAAGPSRQRHRAAIRDRRARAVTTPTTCLKRSQ